MNPPDVPPPPPPPVVEPDVIYPPQYFVPQTSGTATASMVCGIIGLIGCCCCPMLLASLAAIVTGHLAMNELNNRPGLQGRGMAIAGLVMGYLAVLMQLASLLTSLVNPAFYKQFNDQMEKAKQEIRQQVDEPKKEKLPPDAT